MTKTPSQWPLSRLVDVCEIQAGKTPSKFEARLTANPRPGRTIPFYKVGDMANDPRYLISARVNFAADEAADYGISLVRPGAVVFPKAGGAIATNKKRLVRVAGGVDLNCMAVSAGPSVDDTYLYWWFQQVDLGRLSDGSILPQLSKKTIAALEIPVPTLEEQRRIVAILEDHLGRLDAAITSITSVEQRSTRLVDAQRRLLLYPESALTVPIADIASVVNGSTPKGIADVTVNEDGPGRIPYIKVGDMNSGDGVHVTSSRTWIGEEDASRLGLRVTPPGTVIFPKRGGAIATNKKRVLARPAAFDLNTMGVVPGPDLLPSFLRMYFESVDLSSIADGSNIPQINAKGMARLRVPKLDVAAQRRAVSSFECIEEVVSRYMSSPLRERASQLRMSLLEAAFSGRLTREPINV